MLVWEQTGACFGGNECTGEETGMLIGCLITFGALALNLFATERKMPGLAAAMKMVASTGFMGVGVAAGALGTRFGWCVLAGLAASWWGDLFLISRREKIFLAGVGAFFLAHVVYVAGFLVYGVQPWWSLAGVLLLAGPAGVVLKWVGPKLGSMRVPVYAYIMVISLMVAAALGAVGRHGTWVMLAGAVLFYCSDLFVARDRFVTEDRWNHLIGLPLYYGGQLVFAYSISLAG